MPQVTFSCTYCAALGNAIHIALNVELTFSSPYSAQCSLLMYSSYYIRILFIVFPVLSLSTRIRMLRAFTWFVPCFPSRIYTVTMWNVMDRWSINICQERANQNINDKGIEDAPFFMLHCHLEESFRHLSFDSCYI